MITLAGIMITIMSWIAYNEVLNVIQMVGICCVLVAVTFMGIF
jgi:multidrug transporter EmrE-like cation transporter